MSPKREEKEATRNIAILSLSTAIGSAVAGLGIASMGFSFTLSILMFASAIIGIPAALLWQTQRKGSKLGLQKVMSSLDPRGRERTFWFVSFTILFWSLATYPLLTLLLPVFMSQQLGYNYSAIGIAYMLYNVIASSVTFSTLKASFGVGRVVIQSLIALFALSLLARLGNYFPALF